MIKGKKDNDNKDNMDNNAYDITNSTGKGTINTRKI